jgi:hypothetical protein
MRYAGDWWEGSYANILYPKANLTSQRISDFLADIGDEGCFRGFFSKYMPYLGKQVSQGANILIDSTGLPNSIRFPLTAISNHNGEISQSHFLAVFDMFYGKKRQSAQYLFTIFQEVFIMKTSLDVLNFRSF